MTSLMATEIVQEVMRLPFQGLTLAPPGVIPKYRARSKLLEMVDVAQNQKSKWKKGTIESEHYTMCLENTLALAAQNSVFIFASEIQLMTDLALVLLKTKLNVLLIKLSSSFELYNRHCHFTRSKTLSVLRVVT